jgi:hypothetical protein
MTLDGLIRLLILGPATLGTAYSQTPGQVLATFRRKIRLSSIFRLEP